MNKRLWQAAAAFAVLACTFYAGYVTGERNGTHEADPNVTQAIHSEWVQAAEPPLPVISINGTEVQIMRGSYSWCSPGGNCVAVDAAMPGQLPALKVAAGSLIDTQAPEGIKSFTITNIDTRLSGDPYYVPAAPGKYTYRIECEWFLDQGQADYYFTVEAE